ncbi:DUF3263 domain-containing protein [Arthrobacter sp. B3I4]|uniref:DUF3263 domain-containing protein n=1 Tax=Arthrobacter sp. B3I4 TaxID=3042267 RepID=UPI00278A135D|nr:DUF3263 domain-containing protein [Arthrobacter sp. B3I4]MDQ0756129.1 hypothetical protein [Arthrobacter sp. B3I4]
MDTLTGRDKGLIRLAAAPFKYPAARERQAREEYALSGTRFWQEVNRILDLPDAYAWNPQAVGRLKDQRTQTRQRPPVRRLV